MESKKIWYTKTDNKIEIDIYVEKTKKSAFIFFVTSGTVIMSMPFVVFVLSIVEDFDLGFGLLLSVIAAGIVSFYLFRMAFWNMYGIEKYIISKNIVTFIADYKFYKDTVMTINDENICVGYFDKNDTDNETLATAKLIFSTDKNQILSTIDLSIGEIHKIAKLIEKTKFLG
jgi:hypothetical protein